jgi:hypothetical protein
VIARTCGLHAFRDVVEEARRFLSLPRPEPRANAENATGAERIARGRASPVRVS